MPELRIGTATADLGLLYPWLDAAAEAWNPSEQLLNGMHVALEEAVMNVAMHAFAPDEAGEITIRLHTSPETASLIVEDSGRAFDPTAVPAAAPSANLMDKPPGGLGLTLLHHYCNDITYQRIAGRNLLTLRFPLAPRRG
jgi:anti-sigma regulatory factor (Ser/Thr protein kinase)